MESKQRARARQRQFIDLVKQHPELYEKSNGLYYDINVNQLAWKEIGRRIGLSAAECKLLWIKLRSAYTSAKKRLQSKSSQELSTAKRWVHLEQMSFLDKGKISVLYASHSETEEMHEPCLVDKRDMSPLTDALSDPLADEPPKSAIKCRGPPKFELTVSSFDQSDADISEFLEEAATDWSDEFSAQKADGVAAAVPRTFNGFASAGSALQKRSEKSVTPQPSLSANSNSLNSPQRNNTSVVIEPSVGDIRSRDDNTDRFYQWMSNCVKKLPVAKQLELSRRFSLEIINALAEQDLSF